MKFIILSLSFFCYTISFSQAKISINFDFDKSNLTENAIQRLDSLVLKIRSATNTVISLSGHTDAIGSNHYNDVLSMKRVTAVKNYLRIRGILENRFIDERSFGEKQPLNENRNAEERSQNRRVEILVEENASNNTVPTLKERIADSTVKTGTNLTLRNINFEGGMHKFLPTSFPALKELLDALKTYPKLEIRIDGHICCKDGSGDGTDLETGLENLSEARAKAIYDYLVDAGIDRSRLSYKGLGHSQPLFPYPEMREEQQIANRRVEIKILKK